MTDIPHTTPQADSLIPKGTWVEVRTVILPPSDRAAAVPAETAAITLGQRVRGFLDQEAHLGDEVTVTSEIGGHNTGVLDGIKRR